MVGDKGNQARPQDWGLFPPKRRFFLTVTAKGFPEVMPHDKATLDRVALEYPQYCMVGEAARILNVARNTMYEFHGEHCKPIEVEGVKLFLREAVQARARSRTARQASRLSFKGIEVERVQQIAETYYKTQRDIAPPHLVSLAKRIAKL